MMANTPTFGLLSQYGMDLDPAKLKEQDLRQRQADNLSLVSGMGNLSAPAAGMAQTGALLAANLTNRGYRPDDSQQRKIAAATQTKNEFEAWRQANPAASDWDQQTEYQRILAKSAFKAGLPDIGSAALTELEQKTRLRKQQDLEFKKLGIETEIAEKTKDATIGRAKTEFAKGQVVEAYVNNDPNGAITGIIQEDGSILTGQGKRIPIGSYKFDRPLPPVQMYGGSGRRGGGQRDFTDREAGEIRASQRAVMAQVNKTLQIDDLFREAWANGAAPEKFIGDFGKVQSFGQKWANTARELAEALSPSGAVGDITVSRSGGLFSDDRVYNLDNAADRRAYANEAKDEILKHLPASMRRNAEYADRYASLMVELGYATARAAEPGAKALTDADFQRAMQIIGGELNNPEALRKLMFSRAQHAVAELEYNFEQFTPQEIEEIVGTKSRQTMQQSMGELKRRIGFDPTTGQGTGSSYGMTEHPSAPAGEWKIISVSPTNPSRK